MTAPRVITPQGTVIGSIAAPGVDRFAGIPFADWSRFEPAVLRTSPWSHGELNGTALSTPCLQNPAGDPRPPTDLNAPSPAEDCLQLNVFRPSAAANIPVMVWAFGGGLCGGYAGNRWFNGTEFAMRGVMVVTVSYRLGALGFMVRPDGTGGMNGINDVRVGLEWVREYIQYFGGDPTRVTLAGQSSGSYLSCTLSVSPLATGLLDRVILQSGPCVGLNKKGWGPRSAQLGWNVTREVMRSLNVTSFDQLKSVKAELIQWPDEYMNNLTLAPYFSGYFEDPTLFPTNRIGDRWARGQINPSEAIIGFNSKDGTAGFYGSAPTLGLVKPDRREVSKQAYVAAQRSTWGLSADSVLAAYPMSKYKESAQAAFIQSDADCYVICPALQISRWTSAAAHRVWSYEFGHFQPSRSRPDGFGCDNGVELDLVDKREGSAGSVGWATHGAETHFMFGTVIGADGLGPPNNLSHCDFNPGEDHLSQVMMRYWSNFISRGDPNGDGGDDVVHWPQYTVENGWPTQMLVDDTADNTTLGPVSGRHNEQCAFWSSWYPWADEKIGSGTDE
eukprot:TRINITY_DN9671_c0_g7_i1.p1 TRINITY_DN9671_c0_g7~~TRINITY_DN9671_c0_g7_i1.p1  ORF type:complete len:559 (-),score=75.67 TRINITY_DN9671_c0_g7_i1:112-1788(-)